MEPALLDCCRIRVESTSMGPDLIVNNGKGRHLFQDRRQDSSEADEEDRQDSPSTHRSVIEGFRDGGQETGGPQCKGEF